VLTLIFEANLTKAQALEALNRWDTLVKDSGLRCFDRFLTTLDNWMDEITNYFNHRQSSGFVEGLNNKLKVLKRRCYGVDSTTTLFQRLKLDLEGYRLFA
jgi:transposase